MKDVTENDESKACRMWIVSIMLNKEHRDIFNGGCDMANVGDVKNRLKNLAMNQIDDAFNIILDGMLAHYGKNN